MKGITSPETILDHVLAYTIGAGEVMQDSLPKTYNAAEYSLAMVPYGPPFYTAILQAAGVLAIKKDSSAAVILYQQQDTPHMIKICDQDIGPIIGKTFLFPEKIKKLTSKLASLVEFTPCTAFLDSIENQISFIRTLSEVEELVVVGVGTEVQQEQVETLISHLSKKLDTPNIFFVHNFGHDKEAEKCRADDDKLIGHIIGNKIKTIKDPSLQFPKLFSDYSKKLKRIPAVVAYTNTSDLGGNTQNTSGYACLVG